MPAQSVRDFGVRRRPGGDAMTVARQPGSLGEAIMRACEPLGGPSNAGLALGVGEHQLAHYSNPNRRDRLPLDLAVRLDRECAAAGGGTPITDWLVASTRGVSAPTSTPMQHIARVMDAQAGLQGAFAEAMLDGRLSGKERKALVKFADQLRQQAGQLRAALLKPLKGDRDAST